MSAALNEEDKYRGIVSSMAEKSVDEMLEWWSLRFVDETSETHYREERRSLKRIPKQIAVFFVVVLVTVVVLTILDLLGALIWCPGYNYNSFDIVGVFFYIPTIGIEFLLYKFKCMPWARGTLFTVILYFSLFYSTLSYYSSKVDSLLLLLLLLHLLSTLQ